MQKIFFQKVIELCYQKHKNRHIYSYFAIIWPSYLYKLSFPENPDQEAVLISNYFQLGNQTLNLIHISCKK